MIPVWARRIEVQTRTQQLRVMGRQRSTSVPITVKSEVLIEFLSRKDGNKPVHLQFANARSDGSLIEFVKKYGPVWGKVESKHPSFEGKHRKTGYEDLAVKQAFDALRREQQLFRLAVRLLRELHPKRQNRSTIMAIAGQIGDFYPTKTIEEKKKKARLPFLRLGFVMAEPSIMSPSKEQKDWPQRLTLERLRYDSVLEGSKRTREGRERRGSQEASLNYHAVSAAHGILCDLFNRFPLQMRPCAEGAIELPSYEREGILPVLYFLLRRDYRDRHYLIKMCKECGSAFKPERGDPDLCKRECYKRYNDRDRYMRRTSTILSNPSRAGGAAVKKVIRPQIH